MVLSPNKTWFARVPIEPPVPTALSSGIEIQKISRPKLTYPKNIFISSWTAGKRAVKKMGTVRVRS